MPSFLCNHSYILPIHSTGSPYSYLTDVYMEVLLWISIIVAALSVVGIVILLVAATTCMPSTPSSISPSNATQPQSREAPSNRDKHRQHKKSGITIQVAGPYETIRDTNQVETIDEFTHQSGVDGGLPTDKTFTKTRGTTMTWANNSSSLAPVVTSTRSVPTSTKTSPQSVPMHAVPPSKSVPVSITGTSSPKSIPSDWFNKSDEPSLSEFMRSTPVPDKN